MKRIIQKIRYKLKWKSRDFFHVLGKGISTKKALGEVRVLCFHGICTDLEPYINGRFLQVGVFNALIRNLSPIAHFLSLDEFLAGNTKADKLNILVTFDDGYANNAELALPVLEKYAVPAVIFCCAHEKNVLWSDLLDIQTAANVPFKAFPNEQKTRTTNELKKWIPSLTPSEIEAFSTRLLHTVEPVLNEYRHFYQLLTDEELIVLKQHPLISLANHGAHHYSCTHLSAEELKEEITIARNRLEKVGAAHSSVFAYPYGHYSAESEARLSEMGVSVRFRADGNDLVQTEAIDRLVINPFISVYNQIRAIQDGKY